MLAFWQLTEQMLQEKFPEMSAEDRAKLVAEGAQTLQKTMLEQLPEKEQKKIKDALDAGVDSL